MTHLPIEYILLGVSSLLLLSVFASKISNRFGIPALLLFLAIGMLAGSEGPGGIFFNNSWIAKSIGVVALAFILFSGGLDTDWTTMRRVVWRGMSLSTLGVFVTACLVGWFASTFLSFTPLEGLLLGAIVSATDAAAVFSVLKSRSVSLKRQLQPLLELESGSNDPMAVFLTVALIHLVNHSGESPALLLPWFVRQALLGSLIGWGMGRAMGSLVNRVKLETEGLYPVLTVAFVAFTYALTESVGGNGFLAVYLTGLFMGQRDFVYKKTLTRFHDGIAWLMQIAVFLTLGLLVFPSKLIPIAGAALAASLFLVFVARPASVFVSLLAARMSLTEKCMVSWVGLRGAAPVILSTFALLAGVPKAETIFNIVFFIVLTSVLIQGTTVPLVARLLRVDAPLERKKRYPIEFEQMEGVDTDLVEYLVPYGASAHGKTVAELNLPPDSLITMVCRNETFAVASGRTVLEEGDVVLALVNPKNSKKVQTILSKLKGK